MKPFYYLLLLSLSIYSCADYGKKVKKGNIEVYYKEGISDEQAQRTADILYSSIEGTPAAKEGVKSMQMVKGNNDTIIFRMVTDKKKMADASDNDFLAIATILSDSVYSGRPVNVDLTDASLKTIRSIRFAKVIPKDYGEKFTSGNIEVYSEGNDPDLAKSLASFLENDMHPENTISFQLSGNTTDGFTIKMVMNPSKVNDVSDKELNDMCEKISSEVLHGSAILFQLTDDQFNSLKTYTYSGNINKDAAPAAQ